MSKQVHYHQHGRSPIVMHVVKDHKNGKFDLAHEAGGTAVITEIAVGDEIGDGKATPVELAKIAKKGKKAEAKEPAEQEQQEEKAEEGTQPPAPVNPLAPPDE